MEEEPRRRWRVRVGIWFVRHGFVRTGQAWNSLAFGVYDLFFRLHWRLKRAFGQTCSKHPTWPLQHGMCWRCKLEQTVKLAALKPRDP